MPTLPFRGKSPALAPTVFIAPTAWVTGDVSAEENVSFFFGAVARGDINPIRIGRCTNLQENVTLHTSGGKGPCVLGEYVTVGHGAILHGCMVGDGTLIGMGAIVLDDAEIGRNCIIGAGALIRQNMRIPDESVVLGVPGRIVRSAREQELAFVRERAEHYVSIAADYRAALEGSDSPE